MKIIQLLNRSNGGIRQHVAVLSEKLNAEGHDSKIVGPENVMGDLAVQQESFNSISKRNPLSVYSAVKTIKHSSKGSEVIHAHGLTAGFLGSLAKQGNQSLIVSMHNVVSENKSGIKKLVSAIVERYVFSKASYVLFPSKHSLNSYSKSEGEKFRVVLPVSRQLESKEVEELLAKRNQAREEHGIDDSDFLICTVARVSHQKRLDVLIDAFKEVNKKATKTKLFVVGAGDKKLEQELIERVKSLGLENEITFAGYINSPASIIAASDLFVLSSPSETVPFVLLESLNVGTPVVMFDTGIAREVLTGNCGVVVESFTSESFCLGMIKMIEEIESSGIDRQQIIDIFQNFAKPEILVEQVVKLYEMSTQARSEAK